MLSLRHSPRTLPRIPADALLWLGGLLVALAALTAVHAWVRDRLRIHAIATVTENVAAIRDGSVLTSSRLRFRTPEGRIVQVTVAPGKAAPEYPAGATLPIAYSPGNPQSAEIATAWRLYFAPIWLAIIGTGLFDAGWILRGLQRQARRRA